MPHVSLTEQQRRFVEASVESGRYASASEVIRDALRLLQDAEARRDALGAMLRATSAEADRTGTVPADQLDSELAALIAAAAPRP